jgi:hypothetical protein
MTPEEHIEKYALACNAVERVLYPECGDPNDGLLHTSSVSRAVATAVMEALEIENPLDGLTHRESIELLNPGHTEKWYDTLEVRQIAYANNLPMDSFPMPAN